MDRWLKRLRDLILRWNIVRDSCIAMQMDCPIFPGTRMHQLRTGDMPPWFSQGIWNPSQRTVYVRLKTKILSFCKLWSGLKLVLDPLEATWIEEAQTLLYWSQRGRLFLKYGLVCRRWEHDVKDQDMYHQNLITWISSATMFLRLARPSFSWLPSRVEDYRESA